VIDVETEATHADSPLRTRAGRLNESFAHWISNSARGGAFGQWLSRTIAIPQLRQLVDGQIPWKSLRKPLSESSVVLISTGGVHLRSDHPFNLNGDPTFRVIPKDARPVDLAISHQAYDRTDALRDVNLVFPLEPLRELESEHVIGRLAQDHYGFGLMGSTKKLQPAIRKSRGASVRRASIWRYSYLLDRFARGPWDCWPEKSKRPV
jgi:D-proline reductase (dithiol) PrdB